ncbi:DUF2486 domain-containing protein [Cupriavidus oxalaticus]|uniref:hypothetical protein n=1 Tax=Cupriavidus oxalaticus TaxID=96344 RepID=UPI003F736B1C
MSERTTSRVIPRPGPNDSIPLLTEVVELPDTESAAQEGVIDTFGMAESGMVMHVGDIGDGGDGGGPLAEAPPPQAPAAAADPGEDDLRAMRSELLSRVMLRFRTEWPQVVEAHTEATLQARLAPLTAQLASELTQSLEARLVEWLDATLEEIERTPGGD